MKNPSLLKIILWTYLAVWYFADYLLHFGWMDRKDVQEVQSRCLNLYGECKKVLDDCDAAHWMITDFPEMVNGG